MLTPARFLLAAFVIAGFSIATDIYAHLTEPALTTVDLTTIPGDDKTNYWEQRIDIAGTNQAQMEFIASANSVPPNDQHAEAHLFFDAVYRRMGGEAIKLCDDLFRYACFHVMTARSVENGGVVAGKDLYDFCTEKLGIYAYDCHHGIGHGILKLFDDTEKNLVQALEICDSLHSSDSPAPSHGCLGGVIMEYNMRTMYTGNEEPRPLTVATALEPCISLTKKDHRIACALWQPQWWIASYKKTDSIELSAHLGELCRALAVTDSELYRYCILGIGYRSASIVDLEPSKTAEICEAIDSNSEIRFICQKTAAVRFANYFPLEKALMACNGLEGTRVNGCRVKVEQELQARPPVAHDQS